MTLSRRTLLTAAAGSLGSLAAGCSTRPASDPMTRGMPAAGQGSAADDVTGPYDPRRAEGTAIHALFINNTYSQVLREDLAAFTALTGIEVRTTLLPEEEYFDRVTIALVSGLPDVDVFMTGAYMVWQYGPPGWMEDLDPWLANPSATGEDYDLDDLLPHLQDALRWDFTLGEPVGGGGRWALPWWWESNVLAYRADVFDRLGLHPPETFAKLEDTARVTDAHMKVEQPGEGYGLAVRGSLSWATVQAGFMTQFTREGGRDFTIRGGHLAPAVDSPVSVDFHRRWAAMVREAGPRRWSEYNYQNCTYDLGSGRAAMMYDATSVGLPLDAPRASAAAGLLAWSPGPAGPDGDLSSNLWVSSLAMSSRSQQKMAAWLFLQWATGKKHARFAALRNCADPVRHSVLADGAYRDALSVHRGYLETQDAVRDTTRITFTPQPYFFDATTAWAGALQDMVGGADVPGALAALADRMRRRA